MARGEVERRLAAILAADVVGYSRLMEADEPGTVATMKAHRRELWTPMIERCGGRVVGTAGDSILVEFASVVAAVECAAEVQRGMVDRNAELPEQRRMLLRVGVNIGEVIVDGDDIYGDGVNVAARLEQLAEPGGVCISGTVHEHAAGKLELIFEDAGEHEVKNVQRPIHVWRWAPGRDGSVTAPTEASEALALPDKPSIAVLPFDNLSGDPEQEFFADGMSEDIITGLSRFRWFFVIARNSSFTYKGRAVDVTQVAKELGVRYVLEGSVRKGGSRIRVTAQLIDALTGNHIWAERYDRELDDIFALQDEITEAITAAIAPEIGQSERERAQRLPPDSLDAWDCYQRGLGHMYRFSRDDNAEAQELFRRAIALDPKFAPGHAGLTHARYFAFMHDYADDPSALLADAFESAKTAVTLDDKDPDGHFALGRICYLRRDLDSAIAAFETALALNPSSAHAYMGLGVALTLLGERDKAIDAYDKAIRLSPHDPLLWVFLAARALALLPAKRHEEAAEAARNAVRQPTAQVTAYIALASSLGHLGQAEEARRAMDEAFRMKPDISADYVGRILPYRNPADLEHVIEGLYMAGLPE